MGLLAKINQFFDPIVHQTTNNCSSSSTCTSIFLHEQLVYVCVCECVLNLQIVEVKLGKKMKTQEKRRGVSSLSSAALQKTTFQNQ